MTNRRSCLAGATLLGAGVVSRAGAATLPEAPVQASGSTAPPLMPPNGRPYNPVVTLNGRDPMQGPILVTDRRRRVQV